MAFSPDARILAVRGYQALHLLDPETSRVERSFSGSFNRLVAHRFDPSGSTIAILGLSGKGQVWSLSDPSLLVGHRSYVYAVAFSPDGSRIVSAGWDGANEGSPGAVRLWDAESGEPIAALGEPGYIATSVAFTPDGTQFLTCGRNTEHSLRVWDAATGALVDELPGKYDSCAVSPDGSTLAATAAKEVILIDRRTGAQRNGPIGQTSVGTACLPAFSPEGRRLATARPDHSVVVFDVGGLQALAECTGHTAAVHSIRFSADGQRLLTASADDTLRIWDALTGSELSVLRGPGSDMLIALFAPDGEHVLSGSRDGRIRFWHIADGEVIAELAGHSDYVLSLALAPDGETLVSGSGDGTVRVWGVRAPGERRRSIAERGALVDELGPRITSLFRELDDSARVVERLRAELSGRRLEVALQLVLAEAVHK